MRSHVRTIVFVSAVIALGGCASYQPLGTTFIRADGQEIDGEHLAADRAACAEGSDKLESCMSGKGYALVNENEATAKQKEFADAAEKQKKEQLAAAAAEKKRQAAARRLAAKKQAAKKAQTNIAAPSIAPAPAPTVHRTASAPSTAQPASASPPSPATNAQASPWDTKSYAPTPQR